MALLSRDSIERLLRDTFFEKCLSLRGGAVGGDPATRGELRRGRSVVCGGAASRAVRGKGSVILLRVE